MYDGLKSMAKTPLESEGSGKPEGEPVYSYNHCITLEDSDLEKLGLDCADGDCQVGNYLHLSSLAEIVGIHKTDTGEGEKKRLILQLTHMQVSDDDEGDEKGGGAMPY